MSSATFYPFARLPPELRLHIWSLLIPPPRIIPVTYSIPRQHYNSSLDPPITLSINVESRSFTLHSYSHLQITPIPARTVTIPLALPPLIPISFSRDIVYLTALAPLLHTHLHNLLYDISASSSRHAIQSLAIDRRVWNQLCEHGFLEILSKMKELRHVFLVVEFGREFEGEWAFLEVPAFRSDLKGIGERARAEMRRVGERGRRMSREGAEGKVLKWEEVDIRCVILTKGGLQA